ncbi:porin [Rugamonas apoptosis]|uniref:Porin n=1 Tax=Rugamonas apoptosis TaxID=2758570 RepID=A0A7W2F9P2_9BURK|nr:porin [Rugamonas apoptosis]MBA5687650.1 porin [Rugamonas apoptosis]
MKAAIKSATLSMMALGMVSGAAVAQSNVTVYGVADAGLVFERGGAAGSVSKVTSGVASGSRLGFKGTEDLGSGLAANFVVENGYGIDTGAAGQGGLLFGRQAWVGLSGQFGAVALGRQYSPWYKTVRDVADPFSDGLAGAGTNMLAANTRVDNMVSYASPKLAGFSAELAYGAGEVAGDASANRTMGASATYSQGPLTVVLVHHQRENPTATAHFRNTLLTARYMFDNHITGHVAYAVNRDLAGNESKDTLLGGTYTLGAGKFIASVINHQDDSVANLDARQYAVGYVYSLSKRTDLYTAYGHVNNRNGASFKIGNATDSGSGVTGVNLGMRHVF